MIVQSATGEDHRRIVGTLATIASVATRENVEAPAMLIVGAVAAFSEQLAWFEAARHLAAAP